MRCRSGRSTASDRVRYTTSLLVALFCLATFAAPLRAETVHLVEFIYELDLAPFEPGDLPQIHDEDGEATGYVIVPATTGTSGAVYQALDAPVPQSTELGLWAALRFRNHLFGSSGDPRTLEPVAGLPWSPDFKTIAGVAPQIDFSVTGIADGVLSLATGGTVRDVQPGAEVLVATAQRAVSADDFIDAVLAAYRAAGVTTPPAREAVARELKLLPSQDGVFNFRGRLFVRNHGAMTLGDVDLETVWRDARRLAEEGPYEDALAALETLLDVLPRHVRAAQLFHRVLTFLEARSKPVELQGRVILPAGQPDETTLFLWNTYHQGFAIFSCGKKAAGTAEITVPVRDRGFSAHLPSGPCLMTVDVPGFDTAERKLILNEKVEIDVPLQAQN